MVQTRSRKTTHIHFWKEFEISEVTAPASQYILNYVGPQCSDDPTRYGCQCYIDRIDIDDLKKQLFYFRIIHLYIFPRTDAYLRKVDNNLPMIRRRRS